MTAAATFADASLETLVALSKGAERMAFSFLDEEERATDPQDRRAAADLYLRAFQAWRLGVGLALRIMHPAPIRIPRDLDVREAMRERDPPDREPRERDDERDRESDYEPVSLPRFLSTLRGVTKAAEARGERLPPDVRETLPALKDLLVKANAASAPAPAKAPLAILAKPTGPGPASARSRLLGSASAPIPPPRRNSS
jgi:hypothetical protein